LIPPDKARLVIEDFCRTGRGSNEIERIRPDDMPEEGMW
jgi:hypothetical protein